MSETCDVLLVLGGENRKYWPRCTAALKQYLSQRENHECPPKIVLSGGKLVCSTLGCDTEAALMAKFLSMHDVAVHDIVIETEAMNTLGNITFGGQLALQLGGRRIGLVTDDYHHWRSLRLYQRVFGTKPNIVFGTGDAGSWLQRTREVISYVRWERCLQLAKVNPHNPESHRSFLMRMHSPSSWSLV